MNAHRFCCLRNLRVIQETLVYLPKLCHKNVLIYQVNEAIMYLYLFIFVSRLAVFESHRVTSILTLVFSVFLSLHMQESG